MKFYISPDKVESSINYFKESTIDSNDMLFLFLLSKHLGISTSYSITYVISQLSDEQKKEHLNVMWMLGGLFDSTEKCEKQGLMFPPAFKKTAFYQKGTDFSAVLGRIKDTVEKRNLTVPLYDNGFPLTLKSNYRDLIQEHCLKGNKISLSHLSAWIFRFTSFEFEAEPTENQFTRVIEKAIRKFFKITKNDYLWLFENDLFSKRLTPTSNGITGAALRAHFSFDAGKAPEILTPTDDTVFQKSELERSVVEKYLALNGDNPSDSDILNILKSKKQIVLTGVPGVGKSRYTLMLTGNSFFNYSETIQFHASYSYEDFIGGETLETEGAATVVKPRKGVFLEFALKAKANPEENFLFIIDELNRGNIAEIFGETILALDRDYEAKLSRSYGDVTSLKLPENLYIVATMNTSDRNIAFLDLAIRRRFAFVPLLPNYDFLSEDVKLSTLDLGNILRIINQRIVNTLKDPELVLGQSYFIPQKTADSYVWDLENFKNQFNFVILPTLQEYSYNDPAAIRTIIGSTLEDGIQETDEFIAAFSSEFSV